MRTNKHLAEVIVKTVESLDMLIQEAEARGLDVELNTRHISNAGNNKSRWKNVVKISIPAQPTLIAETPKETSK